MIMTVKRVMLWGCTAALALMLTACMPFGLLEGDGGEVITTRQDWAVGGDGEYGTDDQTDALEETSEEITEETSAETSEAESGDAESETQLPRFDYFEADLSEYVTIDAAAYQEILVTLPADLQITDEALQEYLMTLRFAERGEAESETMVDEPLEWGDDAYIYYKGYLDGVAFEGGSNMDDAAPTALGLGSSSFVPGFEAGLVGVIPSETSKDSPVQVTVRFPSQYGSAQLAGKTAVFDVYVVYAVEHELPAYDRAFVLDTMQYVPQKEYASDAALLQEFEQYVKTHLENSMSDTVDEAVFDLMWEQLVAAADFVKLPEEEVTYYYAQYMADFEYYYDYYQTYGYAVGTFDEFVRSMMGLAADADWEAELMSAVTRNVQYDLLRYAIAEQEDMKSISREELDEEINYWIEYYQTNYYVTVTAEDIVENMGEAYLCRSAMTIKMNEYLMKRVTVSYAAE